MLAGAWPGVDRELAKAVAPAPLASYRTTTKDLPAFRFVDLFTAVESFSIAHGLLRRIESENVETLNALLHARRDDWRSRKLTSSSRKAWPSGPDEAVFLPVDQTWVVRLEPDSCSVIIRLRYRTYGDVASLEVAAPELRVGEAIVDAVISTSARESIYRNRVLQLSFQAGTRDEDGDVEKGEQLRVTFPRTEPVEDDDLILEDDARSILLRNVVDLHDRRELLKACGVPVRRGVLLYGPPGTGKTYSCRYLCGRLLNATRIIVTGSALLKVGHAFDLARLLQPSVLFLEDVDLVFMSREVNLYSSVLGELLDQMDGLRPFEDIGFVLTTNAIERMEAAVKDRPGRISQCVYFGPPNFELRRRYLARQLARYDCTGIDVDRLARDSAGATQAFLKEWTHRAVQIASERPITDRDEVGLETPDFDVALAEMRRFLEGSAGRIIGFHAPG